MLGPYPRQDPPANPKHQGFPLVLRPGDWGIPLAGLISRFAALSADLADLILPMDTDYDVCIYSFSLAPWVHERVYAAAALNCHGKLMPKAYLLRHIAVSMMYALHDKRPDMSELQVFQTLIKVHFRQFVITGRAPLHRILFAEVRWVDASSV
ncbi:hypothetical protein EYR40_008261 [Pleurotus pulmonarius]|nr:hypothetical protein EYR36_009082 [Pleurotus pulmonarius]KAF4597794.1 hypothetical protein EYR40_008261 [Pleurotus pulmonarius]